VKIDLPTIETSSGPFGAIVGNLDLERPTQPSVARLLRDALATHKLLRFEVPEATPEIMTRLGRCFGVPHPYPHASPMPGHPLVLQIEKGRHDTVNFGGMWHADLIYDSNPSAATLVGMVQTPESGGDTLFADGEAAASALPSDDRSTLRGVVGRYHAEALAMRLPNEELLDCPSRQAASWPSTVHQTDRTARHPVLARHPVTGSPTLCVSRAYLVGFEGMSPSASDELSATLEAFMTQDRFVVRLEWKRGTIAVWDNRCLLHRALNDYQGMVRIIRRVSILGHGPVVAAF
jgi:taurine dioxygenase